MFVLSSDFDVPPFSLPDLGSNNSFEDFVENIEEEILKKLLGKTFYDQLIAGLEAAYYDSEWSATTTYSNGDYVSVGNDVWQSLQAANLNHPVVEGAWWTLIEEDNKWLLLKNGNDYTYNDEIYEWLGIKKMLIPYVYYRWIKDTQFDFQSGAGAVQPDVENGQVVNPGPRLTAAYNKFSKIAGGDYDRENSMYGYLKANETDFADFQYFPQGRINTFNF